MVHILPAAPLGTTDQMSPIRAADPTYRDNNLIADYELTSIVRPSHRPAGNDDGTITSISFDDKTNDA